MCRKFSFKPYIYVLEIIITFNSCSDFNTNLNNLSTTTVNNVSRIDDQLSDLNKNYKGKNI